MPAIRLTYRRRSSLAIGLIPVKPGNYGIGSPRNVTFAPNVTPGTYVEPDAPEGDESSEPSSSSTALFPPAETPAPPPSRRRVPPGKRRSQGYIPRPPNAFMLFRADFVRQKHVPGSIETNHGSLSKIIGNCWRALPLDEKRIWENRAKKAKAEHRERYPNYRFRPVHNKHKKNGVGADGRKDKTPMPADEERRCEEVAQLLLEGKKGDELAAAIRILDSGRDRDMTASASPMLHMPIPLPHPTPLYMHRRPSSVPPMLYHGMNIPSLPFLQPYQQTSLSRPETPIGNIARSQRMMYGQRRPSSACPIMFRSMTMAAMSMSHLQADPEPLPPVDTSLFEPSYIGSLSGFTFSNSQANNDLYAQHFQQPQQQLSLSISPLDPSYTADPLSSASTAPSSAFPFYSHDTSAEALTPMNWLPQLDPSSGPSSAFSGSPAPSEMSLPVPPNVIAPQPHHPTGYEGWNDADVMSQPVDANSAAVDQVPLAESDEFGYDFQQELDAHYGMDMSSTAMSMQDYSASGFEHALMYSETTHCGVEANLNEGYATFHDELTMEVRQY